MKFNTTTETVQTATIALDGRLDAVNSPALREELAKIMGSGVHEITLDLSELEFVDSAGLAALVSAMKTCRQNGGDLELIRPRSDAAYRVFELTKFDSVFKIRSAS